MKYFFTRTYEHHRKDTFKEAMECLLHKDNIVCTCSMVRQKTSKPYYTFLNLECVQKIAEVKLRQNDFNPSDSLLGYNINYVNYKFKFLNDRLNLGKS